MRILLVLVILLAACSKKKDEAPSAPVEPTAAAKTEEAKPVPTPTSAVDEPTPTEPDPTTPDTTTKADMTKPDRTNPDTKAEPAKPDPARQAAPAATGPTKEAAIKHLREVLAAIEAKDWKKAVGYFAFPAAERPRNIEEQLAKLIELKEISAKGIDVLAAKGKYGKLAEVMEPEKAARFAEKFAVKVDECYGFSVESAQANATVGFHWDGTVLRLIRLNNVGKLE